MKKILSLALIAACTLPTFLSCSETEKVPALQPSGTLTVETGEGASLSRVSISPDGSAYKMNWDGDETAKLAESNDVNSSLAMYNSTSVSVTDGKATFSFSGLTPVGGASAYEYAMFYPASAVGSSSGSVVALTLPTAQAPAASSADPAAALLYGESNSSYDEQPSSLKIAFSHIAAYGKMNLKGLVLTGSETLTSVSIEAEDCNIAGGLTVDVSDGSVSYAASSESAITLSGAALTPSASGFDVWFACKPFTLAAGKTLTVTTTTSLGVHTSVLTAEAAVEFEAGKVTEFPAFSDIYTVTFDTDGGSSVGPVPVKAGKILSAPADPTKAENLAQGLYAGDLDPDNCSAVFEGWYSDPGLTSPYDFSAPVNSDLTLYAKWTGHELIDTAPNADPSNNTIMHESFNYINAQSLDAETHYTLVLTGNLQFWGGVSALNKANAVLHIAGKGAERKIFSTSKWFGIININAGSVVLEKNLLIYSACTTEAHNHPVLYVYGRGGFTMKDGVRLNGSLNINAQGVAVSLNNGGAYFNMEGGEICGNSGSGNATSQSTVFIGNGRFTMNGGVISGNSITSNLNTTHIAGGVAFNGWAYNNSATDQRTFVKNGGEIKDNTATRDAEATGETTGLRGQQVLLYGRSEGSNKMINDNIGEGQNLDASTGYWNAPWVNAVN